MDRVKKTWYWVRPVESVMLVSRPLMVFIDKEYANRICEKLSMSTTITSYEVVELEVEVKDGIKLNPDRYQCGLYIKEEE